MATYGSYNSNKVKWEVPVPVSDEHCHVSWSEHLESGGKLFQCECGFAEVFPSGTPPFSVAQVHMENSHSGNNFLWDDPDEVVKKMPKVSAKEKPVSVDFYTSNTFTDGSAMAVCGECGLKVTGFVSPKFAVPKEFTLQSVVAAHAKNLHKAQSANLFPEPEPSGPSKSKHPLSDFKKKYLPEESKTSSPFFDPIESPDPMPAIKHYTKIIKVDPEESKGKWNWTCSCPNDGDGYHYKTHATQALVDHKKEVAATGKTLPKKKATSEIPEKVEYAAGDLIFKNQYGQWAVSSDNLKSATWYGSKEGEPAIDSTLQTIKSDYLGGPSEHESAWKWVEVENPLNVEDTEQEPPSGDFIPEYVKYTKADEVWVKPLTGGSKAYVVYDPAYPDSAIFYGSVQTALPASAATLKLIKGGLLYKKIKDAVAVPSTTEILPIPKWIKHTDKDTVWFVGVDGWQKKPYSAAVMDLSDPTSGLFYTEGGATQTLSPTNKKHALSGGKSTWILAKKGVEDVSTTVADGPYPEHIAVEPGESVWNNNGGGCYATYNPETNKGLFWHGSATPTPLSLMNCNLISKGGSESWTLVAAVPTNVVVKPVPNKEVYLTGDAYKPQFESEIPDHVKAVALPNQGIFGMGNAYVPDHIPSVWCLVGDKLTEAKFFYGGGTGHEPLATSNFVACVKVLESGKANDNWVLVKMPQKVSGSKFENLVLDK